MTRVGASSSGRRSHPYQAFRKLGFVFLDRSEAPIILCLSCPSSALRSGLIKCLSDKDVKLKFFPNEKQLWRWLERNASHRVVSVVLEVEADSERIVSRSHSYSHVRSILVRCRTSELRAIERRSRSLIKVDGIFDDDTRLLIKLVVDLTLYSEEIGDDMKEDQNNILAAERHYDRAMKLCNLVEYL